MRPEMNSLVSPIIPIHIIIKVVIQLESALFGQTNDILLVGRLYHPVTFTGKIVVLASEV